MKRRNSVLRTAQGKQKSRTVVQSVRLSKTERAALRAAARDAGVSVSEFVRAMLKHSPDFVHHAGGGK